MPATQLNFKKCLQVEQAIPDLATAIFTSEKATMDGLRQFNGFPLGVQIDTSKILPDTISMDIVLPGMTIFINALVV